MFMKTLPLQFREGHIFVEIDGALWLVDTGAPTSFGALNSVLFAGQRFSLESGYANLTATSLSEFVGVACVGLLGGDVLGGFDHLFDVPGGKLVVSSAELSHEGARVPMDAFMGIPIVEVRIDGRTYRMFFDTGAPISYFQDSSLGTFPPAGRVDDFYPGVGAFSTETHDVPIALGGTSFRLRCGSLPGILGMTLMVAGTQGIVGNAIFSDRVVGYFPRRSVLVL